MSYKIVKNVVRVIVVTIKGCFWLTFKGLVLLWNTLVTVIDIIDGGNADSHEDEYVMFSYTDDDRWDDNVPFNYDSPEYGPGQARPFYRFFR